MNKLNIKIKNLRTIKDLDISLSLEKGVYAISGINGVGKSTFFNVMAKLVYRAALKSYFAKDGDSTSEVEYRYGDTVNVWHKQSGQWRSKFKKDGELFFSGIYEASIIYGNRFVDADKKKIHAMYQLVDDDLCPASDFVYQNLGNILKGNPEFYKNLKKVKSVKHAQLLGFSSPPYLMDLGGHRVHQYKMSTGEFLMIGLLSYIKNRIDYSSHSDAITLLLLDEIDLALHPSAQVRLIKFLNEISSKNNLCIYFSTHSIQILSAIRKDNIYFLERNEAGSIFVTNPCYPIYASRSIYEPDGFDFLILLEDELAKKIVDSIISKRKLNSAKLIRTIPCGGWEKVIELQKEINISKLAGHSCKTISILDGDAKVLFDEKFDKTDNNGNSLIPRQNIKFLPIKSLEKYLREHFYLNPNISLINQIGDEFFNVESLTSILESYRARSDSSKDSTGKGLLSVLKSCAIQQGHNGDVFTQTLCMMIASKFEEESLETALIRELQ